MIIKVVALDVYGTLIALDDRDWSFPPRRGLELFLDECDKKGIKVVTSSDEENQAVKRDLSTCFNRYEERGISLSRFDGFFQLDQGLKDFSIIIGHYDILPSELLVIGDNPNKDIYAALRLGCNALQCPEYRTDGEREWDFGKIDLDPIK